MRTEPELCLVFDLDDTLYLERDYVWSGFNAVGRWVAAELDIPDFAKCAWKHFEQGNRQNTFQAALEEIGREAPPEVIDRMRAVYRDHQPNIRPLGDAIACLSTFKSKAVLALITDGAAVRQRAKCESLGIMNEFHSTVFTGDWGSGFYKPHPRAFRAIQARFANSARRFVYIADNPLKDFEAPLRLGWDTIRVRRPQGLHFEVEAPEGGVARLEIPDLGQLSSIIA